MISETAAAHATGITTNTRRAIALGVELVIPRVGEATGNRPLGQAVEKIRVRPRGAITKGRVLGGNGRVQLNRYSCSRRHG